MWFLRQSHELPSCSYKARLQVRFDGNNSAGLLRNGKFCVFRVAHSSNNSSESMEKPSKLKPNPYFQSVVRFLLVYNTAEASVFKMVVSLGII